MQIRLTGEPPDSVTHDELREGPVTRFFVSVLQPGQWQGVARLGDPRLTPTRTEVYFQDQAQHGWTRDINLGTLTAADSELFTATNPFTLEDAQRREREGADFLQSERLDIQPLRFIRRRDNSNVVALGDELFWRLRAIDPIENWPLYSQREAVSSLPRAEALQFANIRALQMISDSIQELI